jgi:hypothetical protein
MMLVMIGCAKLGSRCDNETSEAIGDDSFVMMLRLLDETRWDGDGTDGIPGLILWRSGIVSLYGMFLLEYYDALI